MHFRAEATARSSQRFRFRAAAFGASRMLMSPNNRGIQHQNPKVRILQLLHDRLEHACFAPAIEALKDAVPVAKTLGQVAPRSARLGDPQDRIDEQAIVLGGRARVAKTGAPWRDLPERFGNWNSVFQRFNRWCKAGVFQTIMEKLQDPDLGVLMLDSTIIRAHQHAAGAEGSSAEAEALGRSRGGFSTKVHVACDGLGKPVKIILTPGQDHDVTQGPALVADTEAKKVIADKGYDSDELIAEIESSGAKAVIPP